MRLGRGTSSATGAKSLKWQQLKPRERFADMIERFNNRFGLPIGEDGLAVVVPTKAGADQRQAQRCAPLLRRTSMRPRAHLLLVLRAPSEFASHALPAQAAQPVAGRHLHHSIEHDRGEGDEN